MIEPIHVLSLGAGVQSSTLALMAAKGEITPMPTAAVFADTGAEPAKVMEWLQFLEKELPFPVHRVMEKEGLTRQIEVGTEAGSRFAPLPLFTESAGGGGMMRRQCTNEFKIVPIERKVRELLGLEKGQRGGKDLRAITWIGISTDEIQRMKESRLSYVAHRWPLIEKRMNRANCLNWMEANGYPPPRDRPAYIVRSTRITNGGA